MIERRRAPRAPLASPIAAMQACYYCSGSILDISEYGIRYSKPSEPEAVIAMSQGIRDPNITIQTVQFLLPNSTTPLRLVLHVIREQYLDGNIETSGEFIATTISERQLIKQYVDRTLS